ncbi:MAG: asparagine synthase (glutamine-hydrolyzing) [Deltaproteobacteria bacterium]|nr:asparagine synthase (glutamine-hydrolyzing) [Deltaproteobacteria bacterium]
MCGIAGLAGPGATREAAEAMVESLAHRGPDERGLWGEGELYLCHTRLSIIDLATGSQPMANADGSVRVVFNGEIYNFADLRAELQQEGYAFRTRSDTEVLVHGYAAWGAGLFPRLDGMFAFAVYDARRRRLVLARDTFGIKPLHYHFDGATLRFASEIKALLRDGAVPRAVDHQALHWFLNLRYVPGERTLFEGIRRLAPGHSLTFEGGAPRDEVFAELAPTAEPRRSEGYYCEGIRHYLRAAVLKQRVSDVPLGVTLSGGLDSSSLVALMTEAGGEPLQTFAMGFNEPTDELDDARSVARHFGTRHHEIALDPEPLRQYPEVIWATEEPKENILQGYLLARFVRPHVKVVLGGLGGDELFAGYINNRFLGAASPWHGRVPASLRTRVLEPLSGALYRAETAAGCLRFDEYRRGAQLMLALGDPRRYYLILRNAWDYDSGAFPLLYGPAWEGRRLEPTRTAFEGYFRQTGQTFLEQALWAELRTKLVDDFLLNEDRTSMANGLEVRVPFLDRDLVRFALGIPGDLKLAHGQTKYIFRKAMEGILPARALHKKKWGFSFNPYWQFQKDLRWVAERVLTRRRVEERGWFNYRYLRAILDHPAHPRLRWHYFFLWLALGLEIWARQFLEGDRGAPPLELEAYF